MDKHIGAQFYTIRDYCTTIEDFDASCKKIADIGYKIVQISGTPLKACKMRKVLDKYGLKCVLTHRGYNDFVNNIDDVINYNKELGSDICGLGMLPVECLENKDTLDDFISNINKCCEKIKEEKMYFAFHNHATEFAKVGGKIIMDRLEKETDPEVFNFIVDVYWLQVAGKNPSDYIKRLGKRAMAIHFKDVCIDIKERTVSKMAYVGEGNLDWDGIIEACEIAGSRFALVEQDENWIQNDPFLALSNSYEFLKTKGLL